MKNLYLILFVLLVSFLNLRIQAQELELINNLPEYSTTGYLGNPIEYEGNLYVRFRNDNGVNELVKFDGNQYTTIPNPPNHSSSGRGYFGNPIIYEGDLYLQYYNDSAVFQLYKYDGSDLTLIPNPTNHSNSNRGYRGFPIIYDGQLYLQYQNNSGLNQLYKYDGNDLTLIPNPPNHTNNGRGYIGNPIVFENNLYLQFSNDSSIRQLYRYDGSNLTLIPNPPNHSGPGRGYSGFPIVYDGELYLQYFNDTLFYQLYKYNGTNLTLVSNPPNHTNSSSGYRGNPIVYNDELYLQYLNNSSIYQLYKYDGSSLTLIPNPTNHTALNRGYFGSPIINDGELYLRYYNNSDVYQLYKYDGANLTLIPNPPNHNSSFRGYFGQPTAYNGDLYLRYRDNSSLFQMYWFATPYVWTGNEDSSWDNAINWDDGEVPPLVSSVKIPNTATQPFIDGNLDVSLTSFTIEPDAKLEVKGSLKVTNRLTNNGQITFKSDGFGTGQFDEFTGVYSGTGSVQTEQYIPARRAFRLLSPTVTTTSSINANWQEGQDNTPGFGTHITGSVTGANGFDATETGNPSMYTFNNALENQSGGAGWEAVTNTDVTTLTAGTPVRLFVRGDRTIDLTDNDATATATTLRAEGDLHLGDFEPTISAFGGNFNFVTNPYQAKVDFDAISFTGDINTNFIYEWDPQLNARGGYKTTEVSMDGLGGIPVRIQVGQAFFIRNNSTVNTPPTITFTESSKDVSDDLLVLPPPPPERSAATTSSLNLELFVMNKTELLADKAQLRFSEDYTNAVTDADAGKLGNPGENLALVNSNQLLSIEQRKMPVVGEELQLLVNNYESKNYSFQIQTDNWMEEVDIYIKDNYLDELKRIDAENEFHFSVDPAISESTSILRFSLVFDNVTLSNDNSEESRIQVYPNPAQDVLYLSGITEDVSVQLFDLLGKEVLKIQKVSNKQALPIDSLSNGVYIVKVNGSQKSFTKKIIKN